MLLARFDRARRLANQTSLSSGSRLFVWNYLGGFEGFLLPFPNYYTAAKDIAFLAEHGVTGTDASKHFS